LQDWTVSAVASNNLFNFFDLGVGASWQRLISVNESVTTPPNLQPNTSTPRETQATLLSAASSSWAAPQSVPMRFIPNFKIPFAPSLDTSRFSGRKISRSTANWECWVSSATRIIIPKWLTLQEDKRAQGAGQGARSYPVLRFTCRQNALYGRHKFADESAYQLWNSSLYSYQMAKRRDGRRHTDSCVGNPDSGADQRRMRLFFRLEL